MRASWAALAIALALAPAAAFAQSTATPVVPGSLTSSGCPSGYTICYLPYSNSNPAPVGPVDAATTQTGSTVTTHAVFQSALAASATRLGCTIQNTSTDIEYVFFGATGSATTSNSFALGPAPVAGGQGGWVNCNVGGPVVAKDNVAITSKTTDGATFVVSSQ